MGDWLQNIIVEIRMSFESAFLALLILKISGAVSISWWWICSPMLFLASLIVILLIIYLITKFNGKGKENRNIQKSN